jgi:hypothetical protein
VGASIGSGEKHTLLFSAFTSSLHNDPSTFRDTVRDLRDVNRASAYAGFQSRTPPLDGGFRIGEIGESDWLVVTSPTTIPAGEVFHYNIESKLPYYELKKTRVEEKDGFTFS